MPANILQEVVGITVAFLICFVADLKQRLKKARLLPDWEGEFLSKKKEAV
jgi:hypothetical protein